MQNPYKGFSHINPQRDHPHRRIERTVFRALIAADLPGVELSLVLFVIEKTWGYNKTWDFIPLNQFADATGHDRSNILKSLSSLAEKRVLVVANHGPGRGKISAYMFNKHWDTWLIKKWLTSPQLKQNVVEDTTNGAGAGEPPEMVAPPPQLESKVVEDTTNQNVVESTTKGPGNVVISSGNVVEPRVGNVVGSTTSIENNINSSIERGDKNKNTSSKHHAAKEPQAVSLKATQLAEFLKTLILRNNPRAKTPTDLSKWAVDFDRMIRIDLRTPDEIEAVLRFSQDDDFWCANILSASKLREKFDQLYMKHKEREKYSAQKREKGGGYDDRRQQQAGRGTETDQREPRTADRFAGFRAIESGPGEPDD
jgi:phage replication O-like protein O